VKQLFSRIKPMLSLMFWDLVTTIALFFLLWIVLHQFSEFFIRLAICLVSGGGLVMMLTVKYRQLSKQYGRDNISGGKNKREFERVARMLLKSDSSYVLVYANIDRFKLINDVYGNDRGDKVLHQVQSIIDDELLWDEVSGRIMADNFGILMRFQSLPKLEQRLYRISQQLAELKDKDGRRYGLEFYYGVYIIKKGETNISVLLERANMASKKITNSNYLVSMGIYDERDRDRMNREKMLEMKMHDALESGHFVPYLQPKYELEGETVAGAEALVRWIDPEEGMIYPNEFIPLFEKNGFVVNVDLYMFEEVCKMLVRWQEEGRKIIPISVNLSRSHFEIPNFFQGYQKILKEYDIPPKSIEIELTESLFYHDIESLNLLVNQIHNAGLSCSIDDFGSGYSSLNMLKDVKVDTLKLDRVFFQATEDNERGKNIISSVLHLAQALELHTVSEGVEERTQVEFLKSMNCDLIQGYVFAKPMPVPEFEEFVFDKK